MTFLLSLAGSYTSKSLLGVLDLLPSVILLAVVVAVGIAFDIVGVAATAASERPFHAMAADRVPGARQAILLVREADAVASFSNDIVGDVAGTLSGAIGATIALRLLTAGPSLSDAALTALLLAAVASVTVGGKALGKGYAIDHANAIVYRLGWVLYWVERLSGLKLAQPGKASNNRNNRGRSRRGRGKRDG